MFPIMTNESARAGDGLIAKDGELPAQLSLLHRPRLGHRGRTPGNYRKYRSIRIDNLTEQTGSNSLTLSAGLLENNLPLSAAHMGAAFEWGVPQGLRGLFRVGA
jgi:hypothetical protein